MVACDVSKYVGPHAPHTTFLLCGAVNKDDSKTDNINRMLSPLVCCSDILALDDDK